MHWIMFAMMAVFAITFLNVAMKVTAGTISPILSAVYLQAGGLLAAILIGLFYHIRSVEGFMWTKQGIIYSLITGAVVGIGNWGIILMYNAGAPVGISRVFISTLTVLLLLGIGAMFFSEHITLSKAIGVTFSIFGIYLVLKT